MNRLKPFKTVTAWINKQVGLKITATVVGVLLLVSAGSLAVLSWVTPFSVWMAGRLGIFILFAGVLVLLGGVFICLTVNLYIGRPLMNLNHTMQRVKSGALDVKCDVEGEDELGLTQRHFNAMMVSLKQVGDHRKHIEQKLIKAEESLKYKLALEDKASIIARMNRELTAAFNDITLLYTVSQNLNSVLEVDELITTVNKIFADRFACDSFVLYLAEQRPSLKIVAHKGLTNTSQLVVTGQGLAGHVLKRRRGVYVENAQNTPNLNLADSEAVFLGSLFCVPLIVRDEVIGILTVCRHKPNSFTPTDRQSLESIASQIAVAFDRSQLYSKTKELSVRDELTNAHNRRYFMQMLDHEFKRVQRFKRPLSLLLIDVDNFKRYNDTFGHGKGDELLKKLSAVIQASIRQVDLLARYGGEEFIVMLPDTSYDDAIFVGNKLRKTVKTQLLLAPSQQVLSDEDSLADDLMSNQEVTISVGVSTYPECAQNIDDLINSADMAMYLAKRDGRDLVRGATSPVTMVHRMLA